MINATDLPNDINALKALLLARDEKILGLEAQLNTRAVTFRNRCDVLEITATTGREVAEPTSSCSVTLATANFRYRPKAAFALQVACRQL